MKQAVAHAGLLMVHLQTTYPVTEHLLFMHVLKILV